MNFDERSKTGGGFSPSELLLPMLFGLGTGVAAAAVLLFAIGAAVYSASDPNRLVTAASMIILAVSSFGVGFAGAKKSGSALPGVIAGVLFALLVFFASLIFGGEQPSVPSPYSYLVRLGGVAVSALGAYLATRGRTGMRLSSPRRPKIKK